MNKKRCSWVSEEEVYIRYHDNEWGVPTHDDRELFEMLVLESFQAGLSWITILKKRENFKRAFDDFDVEKVAGIRHKGKITSAITNAKAFIEIQEEFGSFDEYIWSFTDGNIIKAEYLTESDLSKAISKDLKKRGMKFVGPTIIYSYLESIGIIDNHEKECFKF